MSEDTAPFVSFEQFKAEYEDTRSSSLVIKDENVIPSLAIYPSEVTFSEQTVATDSYRQVISVVNESQQAIEIESIDVFGNFTVEVTIPELLRPRSKIEVNVIFSPDKAGENTGNLIVRFKRHTGIVVADLLGSGV